MTDAPAKRSSGIEVRDLRTGVRLPWLVLATVALPLLGGVAEAAPAPPARPLCAPLPREREPQSVAQGCPRWVACGTILAVERERADGPVVELVDTRTRRRTEVAGCGPSLGDQGRFVAVLRMTEGGPRIVVCELKTGRELVLPGLSVNGQPMRWAPKGPQLLVTLQVAEAAPPDLFLLDLSAGAPELLQLTHEGGGGGRWLGRGERVIYEVPDGQGGREILLRDRGGRGEPRRFWTDEPFGPPDPSRIS